MLHLLALSLFLTHTHTHWLMRMSAKVRCQRTFRFVRSAASRLQTAVLRLHTHTNTHIGAQPSEPTTGWLHSLARIVELAKEAWCARALLAQQKSLAQVALARGQCTQTIVSSLLRMLTRPPIRRPASERKALTRLVRLAAWLCALALPGFIILALSSALLICKLLCCTQAIVSWLISSK